MTRPSAVALTWLGLAIVVLVGLGRLSPCYGAVPSTVPGVGSDKACLASRTGSLAALLATQPVAKKGGAKMVTVTRGSPRWMAAWNAVLAWENDDCPAFSAFIEKMGYKAVELRDPTTGHRSWVVLEEGPANAPRRYNGLFALRAPSELAAARRLVISAPIVAANQATGGQSAELYEKLNAAALLVATAERCSLETCSGCRVVPGYACGGCSRASDAANSVDNLLFALFAALEATRTHNGARPYLHLELLQRRAASAPAPAPGCAGVVTLTEGGRTAASLSAVQASDDNSYPVRLWRGLEKRLQPKCVCYHQRERGCSFEETQSVLGHLVNQESPKPFDPCTQDATRLSSRHLHLEWQGLPIETLASALAEAVPQ